ncbi:MAG: Smr/MutS family protein [Crocinitomicaceae bacterium]
MDFKKGDTVSVIHDLIEGTVFSIQDQEVTIVDTDGFNRIYKSNELSLKKSALDYKLSDDFQEKEIQNKLNKFSTQGKPLKKFEIDLHIEELVQSHSAMTNHEILMKQMMVCKSFVQNAIAADKKKIVLIHGKGEGVLKSEIYSFLKNLQSHHDYYIEFHDAPYTEYGMGGATEVLFKKS